MGTTNSDIFVRPRIESNDGDGERQRLEQREGARNNISEPKPNISKSLIIDLCYKQIINSKLQTLNIERIKVIKI